MFWFKLGGYGIVAIAAAILAWKVNGWHNDALDYRAIKPAFEALVASRAAANAEIERLLNIDESEFRKHAEALAALERQQAETERAWGQVRVLEESINAETGCPVVRLSDAWGVCFSAAAAGNAADVAACQAARGHGTIAANAGN